MGWQTLGLKLQNNMLTLSGSGLQPAADNPDDAVETAVNVLQIAAGVAVGAGISLLVGIVIWWVLKISTRRITNFQLLMRRAKIPYFILFILAGGWQGLDYISGVLDPDKTQNWIPPITHVLFIATIVAAGWMLFSAAFTIQDIAKRGQKTDHPNRLTTQAQMFRRILQALVVAVTVISVILTFPQARVAMGSLLASAGVVSLVAGIAAQDSLSNTFAGLQLTLTDALRVGDVLVVDDVFCTVEEMTLTYVVLKVWDDRRVIVPSTRFTKNSFENWTRLHTKLLGTVLFHFDWTLPLARFRAEARRLMNQSDLWDGRTTSIQVTDTTAEYVEVRLVVSAADSGDLWDLRCYMREHLLEWVVENAPYALPRNRWQQEKLVEQNRDRSEEEVARLAQELANIENPGDEQQTPPKSYQDARVKASKRRAGKVRRRRLRGRSVKRVPTHGEETTQVLSLKDLKNVVKMTEPNSKEFPVKVKPHNAHMTPGDSAKVPDGGSVPGSVPDGGHVSGSGDYSSNADHASGSGHYSSEADHENPVRNHATDAGNPVHVKNSSPQTNHADRAGAHGPNADDEADTAEVELSSDRMFSGSPEAEERSQAFSGPGKQVQREREQALTGEQEAVNAETKNSARDAASNTATDAASAKVSAEDARTKDSTDAASNKVSADETAIDGPASAGEREEQTRELDERG
ncbi:mechanosensitive ion channel [Gleimia hominis]|uniref:Mechanosensitive ion channel n=1 Tax=Gleimia hominis TaxID=595468 RepID=A0ABU3I7X4_9ACTO|nr:mechanosensitive ion channel domain-containing protein [Gleimia hominis]MDT3766485.1 mechanosensitive ion channel [Gleimia hominis]